MPVGTMRSDDTSGAMSRASYGDASALGRRPSRRSTPVPSSVGTWALALLRPSTEHGETYFSNASRRNRHRVRRITMKTPTLGLQNSHLANQKIQSCVFPLQIASGFASVASTTKNRSWSVHLFPSFFPCSFSVKTPWLITALASSPL